MNDNQNGNGQVSDGDILTVGAFAGLSPEDSRLFASYGEVVGLTGGEVLIEQGREQGSLFVVLSGKLRASLRSEMIAVDLGLVTPGETIGEMSIVDPNPASATVTVLESGTAWQIDRGRFQDFIRRHPESGNSLLNGLAAQLARRLRRASGQLIRLGEFRCAAFEFL